MGASITYHLAKQGIKVLMIERGSIANTGWASRASAGGLRENDRDPRELPLAQESLKKWKVLEDELEADLEYMPTGQLKLFDENFSDRISSKIKDNEKRGIKSTWLDSGGIKEISPEISSEFTHAIYYPNGGHADPYLATLGFIQAAKRYGAIVKTGERVTSFSSLNGEIEGVYTQSDFISCDVIINAAGAWAPVLHNTLELGYSLPITNRSPQMSATFPAPALLDSVISIEGRRLSLKQTRDGRLRAGGGYESNPGPTKFQATFSKESLSKQRQEVVSVLPKAINYEVDFTYYGVEAQCIDGVPILGSVPEIEGYILATGFSGHGFTLSPGVGQIVADIVQNKQPSINIEGLTIERLLNNSNAYEIEGRDYPG